MKFQDLARSLGVSKSGKEALLDIFRRLGYECEEVFEDVEIEHPIAKFRFDYGLLKYGENRYGMIVFIGEICRENEERLMGMCKLVDARYGVLTDFKDIVILKGDRHVNEIPQKDSLKIELGLMDVGAIAIDYDEFEKVDEIDFVVENSEYVYSDMERDEVIILSPSGKLIGWLRNKKIDFRILDREQTLNIISKFL